jgi:Flp pilus assembly protein TadD
MGRQSDKPGGLHRDAPGRTGPENPVAWESVASGPVWRSPPTIGGAETGLSRAGAVHYRSLPGGSGVMAMNDLRDLRQHGRDAWQSCRWPGVRNRWTRGGAGPVWLLLLACLFSGCRLVPRRNPAPGLADARRLSNEGLSAIDRQDLERAEALLARAVKACPVDVDARRHYADLLWRRGERMQAVTQITAALELSPDDPGLCVTGGRMYLQMGLLSDAERLAAEAVRLAPRSASAWHLQGQLAMARGQFAAAVQDFHRGLALAPDDPDLLEDTAEAYLRLDRPRRALATLAILGESRGTGPLPTRVLLMEAAAQEAIGRIDDAIDGYRRAVARDDAPPAATARLAALEAAAGGAVR